MTTKIEESNNNSDKPLKPVRIIGNSAVVSIDKSIVEKLSINDGIFLEQEITDGNSILMKVRKLDLFTMEVEEDLTKK